MTRASLLHILNHVSEISDAETRELEQLAAAFPYCQTAHVLLAKAAHDRGSMLASQRLRRAATYAANRDLLRQLLETPAPSVREAAPVLEQSVHDAAVATTLAEATPEAVTELEADQLPTTPQEALAESRPAADPKQEAADHLAPATTEPELAEPALTEPDEIFKAYLPLASENLLVIPATSEQEQPEQRNDHTPVLSPGTDTDDTSVETASSETVNSISEKTEVILLPIAQHEAEAPTTEVNQQEEPAHVVPSLGVEGDGAADTLATQLSEQTTSVGEEAATVGEQALELFPVVDDLLPATAPPIRPPVEAGISRFEFGLVEPALPPPSSYQLLGLEDDDEPSTVPGELPRAEIPPSEPMSNLVTRSVLAAASGTTWSRMMGTP
ncbi:hypothetical protein [Hymenobacter sp. AT01-02]|uniref:hypothetical protein n=1 Tax=Hymenobacter sp. AT01-02 TaxID=1571877 RepID=UPI0005F229CF|nr:hypothetical protein [Hymenobacter sp. AT01-02]